ncbi:hypothetical protein AAMO2058_001232200 [Amorphochlora amoebiformis]
MLRHGRRAAGPVSRGIHNFIASSRSPCVLHRRWSSDDTKKEEPKYVAPFAKPARVLKVFSVTSCFFSLGCTPVLVLLGSESIPIGARAAVGVSVVTAAIGTTAVLNWLFKPYVIEMSRKDGEKTLEVSTMTFLGRRQTEIVHPEDVLIESNHPMSNWVSARSGKGYYIHTNWKEGEEIVRDLMPMLPLDDDQVPDVDKQGKKDDDLDI